MQEMQELMEMVTTRGRKVRAAVMGVKMDEATPRLAPQRLYEGFSRLGPTLSRIACHLSSMQKSFQKSSFCNLWTTACQLPISNANAQVIHLL